MRRKAANRDEKIEQCAEWAVERVKALARPPAGLTEAPDSQLHVILRRAGVRRRSPQILEKLQKAFDRAGIHTHPKLTDPSVERNTRVYFLPAPLPGLAPRRVLFDTEGLLEDFLVQNFEYLPPFHGLRLRARQYRFPGSSRVIDLLCEERGTRALVGVELKHQVPDRGLPSQMIDYMIELERLAEREQRLGFRGMVITGQPDPRLREDLEALAEQRGYRVDWYLYEAGIKLKAPSQHPGEARA